MAQHVDVIMNNLRNFVSSLSQNNPMMALIKPLASRVIDNNMYKVETLLKQISDKDGLVDIEGILTEMSDNIINIKPFKVETGLLGQLEIGAGKIKMDIPMVNKSLVLNQWIKRHTIALEIRRWKGMVFFISFLFFL